MVVMMVVMMEDERVLTMDVKMSTTEHSLDAGKVAPRRHRAMHIERDTLVGEELELRELIAERKMDGQVLSLPAYIPIERVYRSRIRNTERECMCDDRRG